MTGKELVIAIRKHKGKVAVPVLFKHDVIHLYAEKQDLIEHFKGYGDKETEMSFSVNAYGDASIDTV